MKDNAYQQDIVTRTPITRVEFFFAFWENFLHKFANLVAPPTDGTMKRLMRCIVHPTLYQKMKTPSKSMHNWRRYPSSNW